MEVKAIFDRDTKRFHRFLIDEEEVRGTLYFPRDAGKIPERLIVELKTKKEE